MSQTLVNVENLSLSIDKKQILDKISFQIQDNAIITIIGPNGGGKSTIAKCILNIINNYNGNIWIKPGIKIGYMPQKIVINPTIPIDVINFLQLEVKNKITKESLNLIIKEIEIGNLINTPLKSLSGGELQRVLLARTLILNPDLLILDEPTQGLDINAQVDFYKLIENLRQRRHISILIISHDLHIIMKNTNHVICVNKHICCQGTSHDISTQKEFYNLFNSQALKFFSIYEHHHDHKH